MNFIVTGMGYNLLDTTISIQEPTLQNLSFWLNADCKFNSTLARKDILANKLKLILSGGIAPLIYSSDNSFYKKYKIFTPILVVMQLLMSVLLHTRKRYSNTWIESWESNGGLELGQM